MANESEQITKQTRAEYKAGLDFRLQREKAWQEGEDQYFNKKKKSLKHRYNVPVPIIPGFIETLLSKIDDPPTLKFEHGKESQYKAAMKVTAFYQQESQREDYDWDMIDLDGKKLAALYGRSINKYYANSKPEYSSNLEVVDPYDFIADPMGGGNLEKHRFCGQDNIFRSKFELKQGVEQGIYDAKAVEQLINATSTDKLVDNDTMYRSKQSRLMALGLDGISYNYAGQELYKLIEFGTTFNGKRRYVLFNYETGIGIAVKEQKERFKSNLWQWTSWATHRDIFNFWSKSPIDDIIPLAEIIRVLVNQELDNRLKRNFGQRAYDPAIFSNPAELEFRPDGLVRVKSGTSQVTEIGKGIYEFQTPELQGTINLVQYLDGIIGQKTGVTADAQGQSDEDKVGIYYGNLQQSADRMGLYNKSYKKSWQAIGRRYVWGLCEHLRSPQAVKIIGESGVEWDEIKRIDVDPTWAIKVEGGNAELQADEIKKKRRQEVMATLTEDELAIMSPRWRAEQKLRIGDYEEDDIRMAFDVQNEGNREILAEASQAIEDILNKKRVKLNRGANTAFIQKIIDYATDTDLPMDQYQNLMSYAEAHIGIAAQNAARKAVQMRSMMGLPPNPTQPGAPVPGQPASAPNTPGGTASQSQQVSPQVTPQL